MDPLPPPTGNDKVLIILCHLSLLFGVGFLLPLVLYLAMRRDSPLIAAHAAEVLNFHISLILYALCCIPLMVILIGFPLFIAIAIGGPICAIIAAVKASDGGFYRYPVTIRFIH